MAAKPNVLIVTGVGLNCEAETTTAWELAGACVTRMHLNDLLQDTSQLRHYGAMTLIGGFSFGDHLGSGHVFSTLLRHRMLDELRNFVDGGGLMLGICNGFQIMVKLGLLPGLVNEIGTQRVALLQNDVGHFQNRWVTVAFDPASPCVFTKGLNHMDFPVRHREGKLHVPTRALLRTMDEQGCIVSRYIDPSSCQPTTKFPHNPNGSRQAIAGLCDPTGRVFGFMPHPEAFLYQFNHPHWDRMDGIDGQKQGEGLQLFQNAVAHL